MKMDRRCLFYFQYLAVMGSSDSVMSGYSHNMAFCSSAFQSASNGISCPSPQVRQQSLHKLRCSHMKPNRCSAIPSRASFHPAWLLFKKLISSQEVLVEGHPRFQKWKMIVPASCAKGLLVQQNSSAEGTVWR